MSANLEVSQQVYKRLGIFAKAITDFCQRWHIRELACFGSVIRSVDVATKRAIEQSKNSIRQKNVLGTAQTIYEAR